MEPDQLQAFFVQRGQALGQFVQRQMPETVEAEGADHFRLFGEIAILGVVRVVAKYEEGVFQAGLGSGGSARSNSRVDSHRTKPPEEQR